MDRRALKSEQRKEERKTTRLRTVSSLRTKELAGRRSQPRNAKRSALNRKREARTTGRESRPAARPVQPFDYRSTWPTSGCKWSTGVHESTRTLARSRRYYVRSRIESKVVRESAGRPRRPHGATAGHVLAPRTRLIAVIVNPNEFPRRRGKNRRIRSWNALRSRSTGPSLSFALDIYARACRPYARAF